jgi:chromatin modification-related protein VID21
MSGHERVAGRAVSDNSLLSRRFVNVALQVAFFEVKFMRVMQRINQLKAEGLWSYRQPKKQKGPSLPKSHWDYLLDEMVNAIRGEMIQIIHSFNCCLQRWMSTDFREERRWKMAIAFEIAHSVAEWHQADEEGRQRLMGSYKVLDIPDEGDVDMHQAAVIHASEVMEVDTSGEGSNRNARQMNPIAVEQNPDESDEVAGRDRSAIQPPLDASTALEEALEDMEAAGPSKTDDAQDTVMAVDVVATAVVRSGPGSEMDAEGEPEDDVDAEGEVDMEKFDIPDMPKDANVPTEVPLVAPKEAEDVKDPEGLKPTTRGALLTPPPDPTVDVKKLRKPILDKDMQDTMFSLSELFEANLNLSKPLPPVQLEKLKLPDLFPDLPPYEVPDPPSDPVLEKKSDKNKRIDESGAHSGKLTSASRLMDVRPVLVSSLQPSRRLSKKQAKWEDLNDFPVADEPRDWSEPVPDVIPPAARTFSFVPFRLSSD